MFSVLTIIAHMHISACGGYALNVKPDSICVATSSLRDVAGKACDVRLRRGRVVLKDCNFRG